MAPTRGVGLSPPVTPGDASPVKMRAMQDRMQALELRAQGIRADWEQGESKGFLGAMPRAMASPMSASVDTPQPQQWADTLSAMSPPGGSPVSAYPELFEAVDERPVDADARAALTPEVARFRRTHEQRLRHFREERSRGMARRMPASVLASHVASAAGDEEFEHEVDYDAGDSSLAPRQRRARAMKHVLQSSDGNAWDDWEHTGGEALFEWSERRVRTVGERPDPAPIELTKGDWKKFEPPPRAFVPGGAKARPIHAAMDEHYYRVDQKSPRSPKQKSRCRSTTPTMRRAVRAATPTRSATPTPKDASGRRQVDSRGNLVHKKRTVQYRPPSKRRQEFIDKRRQADEDNQQKWAKARAAEKPALDRNRPFVPAGCKSRPVHQALDIHCTRKSQPFAEPKPRADVTPARRPQVSSSRISPSKPNDPAFQASPFHHLLEEMKNPRKQELQAPQRRPFVPGGAQNRPVHKQMEDHMRKVTRNTPKKATNLRSPQHARSPFDGHEPASPTSPRTPRTPYDKSFDESLGGRYVVGVSARGDARLRAQDKQRQQRDERILHGLSQAIEYEGDVRPVSNMLASPGYGGASVDSPASPHSFGGKY